MQYATFLRLNHSKPFATVQGVETLQTATEIASAGPARVTLPPEKLSADQEPTDAELLQRFESALQIGPAAQLSGVIFYAGKSWPIQAAIRDEREQFLSAARQRWRRGRDARRAQAEWARGQLEAQAQFEAGAARGAHAEALRSQLDRVRGLHRAGCGTAREIEQAKLAKDQAAGDTSTNIDAMQKTLAGLTDRLNALSLRLQAQENEYKKELLVLSEATELAVRELYFKWFEVRKTLIKKAHLAVKAIVGMDDSGEALSWIEARSHAVRSLDSSVGCQPGSVRIVWRHAKSEVLNLAEEVCARHLQFQRYTEGQTCRSYEKMLEPRIVS